MVICVYAASSEAPAPVYHDAARELGVLLAEGGHTLLFGGGAEGLMGACARGALERGGRVWGVAPRFFDEPGVLLQCCERFVFTETMAERKAWMEAHADAFIVLPGGVGTFEEFFETLTLRSLGRLDKPIALVDTAGYYEPLAAALEHAAALGFLRRENLGLFALCRTPGEALGHVTVSSAAPTGSARAPER